MMRPLVLLFLLSGVGCATAGRPKMPEPQHLPAAARDLLTEKMINHGNDMADLLWATLFLDDQSVHDIAEHLRQAPRLARPIHQDATELNASLPAEFFDLQDKLAEQATALAESAAAKDPNAMAAAYGALAETCVRCHSLYLTEPPKR